MEGSVLSGNSRKFTVLSVWVGFFYLFMLKIIRFSPFFVFSELAEN